MASAFQPPVRSPLDRAALLAALGRDVTPGAFADTLARDYGSARVVLTDSGTSALRLALEAAGRAAPGRPVALPAYGCFDLATAAVGAAVPVVLYDVDPTTLAPDEASVRAAASRGLAALVVVHHYGVPVPMDRMRLLAEAAGAPVIEDAAQGIGGSWDGRPLGAHGAMGVLSFGRGKGWTGGGGGALLLRADAPTSALEPVPPPMATGGAAGAWMKLVAQWLLARPGLYAIPAALPFLGLGETTYRAPRAVRGPSAMMLRVAHATRPLQEPETARRREHAARLAAAVAAAGGEAVRIEDRRARPGWLRFPLVAARRGAAARVRHLGVMPGYPARLDELAPLRAALVTGPSVAGARTLVERLCTLPVHGALGAADLSALEGWIREAVR